MISIKQHPIPFFIAFPLLGLGLIASEGTAEWERHELMKSASDWSTQFPFAPEATAFHKLLDEHGNFNGLIIETGSTNEDIGGWRRSLPDFEENRRYRFEARFSLPGITHPDAHVRIFIAAEPLEFLTFRPLRKEDDTWIYGTEFTFTGDENIKRGKGRMSLNMYLSNAPNTRVTFEGATMDVLKGTHQPRMARLAAVSGRAPNPATPEEAISFYVDRLKEVGAIGGVDLVCLPENVNVDLVPGDRWDHLDTIPGMTTRRLGEVAREFSMYVVAGIAEIDGENRYNTAVLIDREGNLAGIARKIHLTTIEHLRAGIRHGDAPPPVFETDLGTIGMAICYDNHWPETARMLALKGAEIIALPNAADGRRNEGPDGTPWQAYMQTRALDNHVFMVSGVNYGESLITSPEGHTMAVNKRYTEEPGGIVYADCNLEHSTRLWMGHHQDKNYLIKRRPEIYDDLLRPYSSFVTGGDSTAEED